MCVVWFILIKGGGGGHTILFYLFNLFISMKLFEWCITKKNLKLSAFHKKKVCILHFQNKFIKVFFIWYLYSFKESSRTKAVG